MRCVVCSPRHFAENEFYAIATPPYIMSYLPQNKDVTRYASMRRLKLIRSNKRVEDFNVNGINIGELCSKNETKQLSATLEQDKIEYLRKESDYRKLIEELEESSPKVVR